MYTCTLTRLIPILSLLSFLISFWNKDREEKVAMGTPACAACLAGLGARLLPPIGAAGGPANMFGQVWLY